MPPCIITRGVRGRPRVENFEGVNFRAIQYSVLFCLTYLFGENFAGSKFRGVSVVGRSPTNCVGLGTTPMSGFVQLQKFCSPIRLQSSSAEGVTY